MEYVYPAIFHKNDDESYTVIYPDLQGCITEGKTLGNAMYMAEKALVQWISYLKEKKQEIPAAGAIETISVDKGEFINLIRVDVRDSRAVRRAVSIPKWMDEQAISLGLSLSKVLQDALKTKFL
jgi:predicted RNase H-like HicB family nuclease